MISTGVPVGMNLLATLSSLENIGAGKYPDDLRVSQKILLKLD